ncbi:transposase [Streptomyces sp. NPDC057245]|uniref:transposase n=1 Tax=Streptomyces TaxID=1883 RepID=UPI0020A69C99|nr:transposase [Streptomyces sp. A108]
MLPAFVGDLADARWSRLERLLPRGKKPGQPSIWNRRQLIGGIRWRARTGAPWRDGPERYGSWDRVYDLFRRWQRSGAGKRIPEQLQTEAGAKALITWDVSVDSTVCRAQQHAAGARKAGTSGKSLPAASAPSRTNTASSCPAAG